MTATSERGAKTTMADVDLSELVGYQPYGMIAEHLFPVVPVVHARDDYSVWDQIGMGARVAEYRAEEYARVAYNTTIGGLHRAQDVVLLRQEIRVAQLATDPANYPLQNAVTLAGSRQWNESGASIDDDIQVGRAAIQAATGGLLPNTIVIPGLVAMSLMRRGDRGPLPGVIAGMRVLMATALYTPSASSAPVVEVWGKHVLLAYVAPKPALHTITLGLIFRAQNWRVSVVEPGEYAMRVSITETEKLIAPACGYLIRDAVA